MDDRMEFVSDKARQFALFKELNDYRKR